MKATKKPSMKGTTTMKRFKALAAYSGNLFNNSKTAAAGIAGTGLVLMERATMATPTPLVDFADVATDVKADVTPAVTAAIGIGVALFVVALGWKLIRRFAK